MSTLSDKNREKVEETLLKSISVKCKECNGDMIRVTKHDYHLFFYKGFKHLQYQLGNDDTVIGYQCQDCPHYNLFDNYPV
jgi:hypothetical protein